MDVLVVDAVPYSFVMQRLNLFRAIRDIQVKQVHSNNVI